MFSLLHNFFGWSTVDTALGQHRLTYWGSSIWFGLHVPTMTVDSWRKTFDWLPPPSGCPQALVFYVFFICIFYIYIFIFFTFYIGLYTSSFTRWVHNQGGWGGILSVLSLFWGWSSVDSGWSFLYVVKLIFVCSWIMDPRSLVKPL